MKISYVYNKRSVDYGHVVQFCSFPHYAVIVIAVVWLSLLLLLKLFSYVFLLSFWFEHAFRCESSGVQHVKCADKVRLVKPNAGEKGHPLTRCASLTTHFSIALQAVISLEETFNISVLL